MDSAENPILSRLRGGLIVSCQAEEGMPLDRPEIIAALAQTVLLGGAVGIRACGLENIRAVLRSVEVPVIGIVKRVCPDSPVYITPTLEDALEVAETGVPIVAMDATQRPRPGGEELGEIVERLRARCGALLMADISTCREGLLAERAGFDLIATTLSGYTEETASRSPDPSEPPLRSGARARTTSGPDMQLLEDLRANLSRAPVIAEGRISTPQEAAEALRRGAFAVVVGSAITRPHLIARKFADAMPRLPS